MSETVRSYTGSGPSMKRRGGWGRSIALGIIVLLLMTAVWTTRDTCPMEDVIPASQTYHLFANDVLAKRDAIANSRIAEALAKAGVVDLAKTLHGDAGIPEWVLNNLVPTVCHVSGNDVASMSDLLFVSRMSRVGCLLARMQRWIPGVKGDPAGGLHIASLPDAGIYFATRGRVLLASPSRDALIGALTLRPGDAMHRDTMANALKGLGAEDIAGVLAFASADPMLRAFKGARFAIRIERDSLQVKVRAALDPEWEAGMHGALEGLAPQPLIAPPDGFVGLSANFGKPVHELWTAGARMAGKEAWAETQWQAWSASSEPSGGLPKFATALLGPLGPGIRFSWCGVDLNEMIPVPQVVLTFDADPQSVSTSFATLPPLASDIHRYDFVAQYDAEAKEVLLPLIGGSSMEPTAGLYGNALLIGSSRVVAEKLLAETPKAERLPQPGNLYLCIRPQASLEAATQFAGIFAENHLLRDVTPESLQERAAPWLAAAAMFQDIVAQASYDQGELAIDLAVSSVK